MVYCFMGLRKYSDEFITHDIYMISSQTLFLNLKFTQIYKSIESEGRITIEKSWKQTIE